MPHIHTDAGQHDITASALIFRTANSVPQMLLHMHKKLGMLMQPGGHVEVHENPWQAVLHEIEEETGYAKDQLSVLQPDWAISSLTGAIALPIPFNINTHTLPGLDHYHTDLAYVFTAMSDPAGLPAEGESTDLRWMTYDEIAVMSDQEINANVKQVALAAFDVPLNQWTAKPVGSVDE